MLVKCCGTRAGGWSRSNRRWIRLSYMLTGLGAELSSCRSVIDAGERVKADHLQACLADTGARTIACSASATFLVV